MQYTKTLIFEVQNLLFRVLKNIFKDEIKIYKILKEPCKNYILIEDVKEEIASSSVKKFTVFLQIVTDLFEEDGLKNILEKLYLIEEQLKIEVINAKIITTEVKAPTHFKGFEARVEVVIFCKQRRCL